MILLTNTDGTKVLVNPAYLVYVERGEQRRVGVSAITLARGRHYWTFNNIVETPEQIATLCASDVGGPR